MEANCIDFGAADLLASEIFAEQIGNYAERGFIEQLSAEFEREQLRAVVRPWEETEVPGQYLPTYQQRKRKLEADAKRADRKPLDFSAAPQVLEEELERYLRMPRSAITQVTEVDGQPRQIYVERIHEIERALGRSPTDFTKAAPRTEQPDHEKRIADFRAMPAAERKRTVGVLNDREMLGLILSDEQDPQIRAAAQNRLLILATAV